MLRPSFANPVGATLLHLGCEILVFGLEILHMYCGKKNKFFLIAWITEERITQYPHLL